MAKSERYRAKSNIASGSSLLNSVINKLPVELHIPGYQFCGPGTRLKERLALGQVGINPLDSACRDHDIAYSIHKDLEERHKADKTLAARAKERTFARNAGIGERLAAAATWAAMNIKRKLGMGMCKRKKERRARSHRKKRKLIAAKRGGILPLLPLLGVLGSLAGGAAGIATAVNKAKAEKQQLEELKRHNAVLEGRGRGLYLAPYKRGRGINTDCKRKRRKGVKRG